MLTRNAPPEGRVRLNRHEPGNTTFRDRDAGREHGHLAAPTSLTMSGEAANDRGEAPGPNVTVAVVLSSLVGFVTAVFAAILGSGVLAAVLIYLGIAVAGSCAVLMIAYLRHDASDAGDDAAIECKATKADRAIYARNRGKRLWYLFTLWAVLSALLIADHWAAAAAVLAASAAAFLWSRRGARRARLPEAPADPG